MSQYITMSGKSDIEMNYEKRRRVHYIWGKKSCEFFQGGVKKSGALFLTLHTYYVGAAGMVSAAATFLRRFLNIFVDILLQISLILLHI